MGRVAAQKCAPAAAAKSTRPAVLGRQAAPTACRARERLRAGGRGHAPGDARVGRARRSPKHMHPRESVEPEACASEPSCGAGTRAQSMLPAKRASGGALRRAGGAASTPCLGRMGLGSPPIAGVRGGGLRALQRRRHDVSADAARHAGHVTMTRDCDRDRCFCSLFQAGLPAVSSAGTAGLPHG